MVKYNCAICQKEFDNKMVSRKIRCPFCSSKVLFKKKKEGEVSSYKSI